MDNLLPGLRKFSERVFPRQQEFFERLSMGQTPHTLLITCSDSRIDPNLVTQAKPGELFVVRNAGNIVPPFGASRGGEEAAIEFAINALRIKNLVLCGHSHCGAMEALRNKSRLKNLPSLAAWLDYAEDTNRRLGEREEVSLGEVIEENVLVQVDHLKSHPAVSSALREDRLRIFGWVYHFETGSVSVYDPRRKKFFPSEEVKEAVAKEATHFSL